MNEPLILLLQRLQTTLVPAILAIGGCVLIITSVVGTFWKRDVTPKRRKTIGCFGAFFLLSCILLYGGPLLLHTYAPTLTIGGIIAFFEQSFLLLLQALQNTPVPAILAGTGCLIILISIIGIFNRRDISRKQRALAACFGILVLLCSIFLYEAPLLFPSANAASDRKETIEVFFREGNKGTTTKMSYHGMTTITISGEAKHSGKGFSDAFYFFGSSTSHPVHLPKYTLWINGKLIDVFLGSIPLYDKGHMYTFKIDAPNGHLTFGVGNGLASDKTGFFTIVLS